MYKKIKIYIIISLITNLLSVNAQSVYTVESKDKKVIADAYIAFDEGIDSVIVKNGKCKLKFSYHNPLFNFYDDDGYSIISEVITIRSIKKIKNKTYLLIGIGGNLNLETQLNLIFIKKNKILKYYVIKSNNKLLRDVKSSFNKKTKEVTIEFPKKYTKNELYKLNIKENKLDTIKPFEILEYNYVYKLKL